MALKSHICIIEATGLSCRCTCTCMYYSKGQLLEKFLDKKVTVIGWTLSNYQRVGSLSFC